MSLKLDKRLEEILSQINYGSFADVGCDHGKLAACAVSRGLAERVIATDISAPSLKKTEMLAKELGLDNTIECRLGDGLKPIASSEVETVVVAGLGGDEITKILRDASAEKKVFKRFVLSPNTHAEKVREEAVRQGFSFLRDHIVLSEKKYYPVIVLEKNGAPETLDLKQLKYGADYKTDAGFSEYARKEIARIEKLLKANAQCGQLEENLKELKDAYDDRK